MNRQTIHIILIALAILFAGGEAFGQWMPERRFIRQGNRDYQKQGYVESEIDYMKALEKDSLSFAAKYNLGNSYYRQGRYEEAAGAFSKPNPNEGSPKGVAESFYNSGNALFQQQKLEEAIESYKQSLRINPDDMEAKFNLAYAKKLLEQNQQNEDNQDDQQQDDQDQNDQQQDDQQNQDQNDQNSDGQNNQDDQGEGDQDSQDQDQNQDQNQDQSQGQQPSGMTREEAEQMLEAMQMSEDNTRDKVEEEKARAAGSSISNW